MNYLAKRFSTRLHPEVMAIQRESAELASVVEETVSGVRVVKGFGSQRVQATRTWARPNFRSIKVSGALKGSRGTRRRGERRRPPAFPASLKRGYNPDRKYPQSHGNSSRNCGPWPSAAFILAPSRVMAGSASTPWRGTSPRPARVRQPDRRVGLLRVIDGVGRRGPWRAVGEDRPPITQRRTEVRAAESRTMPRSALWPTARRSPPHLPRMRSPTAGAKAERAPPPKPARLSRKSVTRSARGRRRSDAHCLAFNASSSAKAGITERLGLRARGPGAPLHAPSAARGRLASVGPRQASRKGASDGIGDGRGRDPL